MENNLKKNLEQCEYIAKTVESYCRGEMYRCPACGEEFIWNFSDYDAADNTYTCPYCKKSFPMKDLQQLSLSDYLMSESILDVEYRLDKYGKFIGAQLLVSACGPSIYIDTEERTVKLYGLCETAAYPLSEETVNELNEFYGDTLNNLPDPPVSNKKYVYLITLDWATEDDKGFEFDICATPKKAFEIFRKRIKAEKNPNKSWVGEEVFAEDGNVKEGYILDTFVDRTFSKSNRWCVSDDDTGRFSDIYLRMVILQ